MRRSEILLALLLCVLIAGCGGHADGGSPAMPAVREPVRDMCSGSSRVLWGMWQVDFQPTRPDSADVELVPLRGASFNANVQRFLVPPSSPVNLITFNFLPETDFLSGYVKVRVGLVHPFPGIPTFRGFDTRCIFMADAFTSGEYDPDILFTRPLPSGGPTNGAYVLNPDGYTRWWNRPEFIDPTPLFSYKPSPLGTDPDPLATLNPYKYYADDLDQDDPVSALNPQNRGTFAATGEANVRIFEIQFPVSPKNFKFNLAVDASWALPDPSGAPDYPIESFPSEAQTQEPFLVEGVQTGGDAFYYDGVSGGSMQISVTVSDWQAIGSPSGVLDEITSIRIEGDPLAAPIDILPIANVGPGSNEASSVFTVELGGSDLDIAGAGDFVLLGTVESADPNTYMPQIDGGENFVYPDAPLAAYFMTVVDVSGTPPQFHIEVPNGGEVWTVGSDHTIVWTGGEAFDTVKIEYSKDDFVADINEIVGSVPNSGSFLWQSIPDDVSDTVKVRVSAADFPGFWDSSDDYFSIVSELLDRIVYRGDGPSPGMNIYSIDPEGLTEPEQWTSGVTYAFRECAKLSPSGQYIMYTFCDLSVGNIVLIDVATGAEKVINPPGMQGVYSDFSHDGTRIVAALGDQWYAPLELWTMDYDGGNSQQLTSGANAWAPEYNFDDTLIFYSNFSDSQVYIYDVATGVTTQYTNNGTWNDDPKGSPDGTKITWATMYGNGCRWAYISPIESWTPPDLIIDFDACVRGPCFNPEGTKLVVDHGAYDGSELTIYDLADNTWKDITANSWGEYMADWGVMIPH